MGNSFGLEGRTTYESIYGHTPDISSLCKFDVYEPVWYYKPNAFPNDKRFIGRWLGEAHKIGQAMCYWVLMITGKPIARSTLQSISEAELKMEVVKSELKIFGKTVITKLMHPSSDSEAFDVPDYLQYIKQDDDLDDSITPRYDQIIPEAAMPEADKFTTEDYDTYISVKVLLPR